MRQEHRPIFQRFRIRGSRAVGRGLPSLKARMAHVSHARLICPAGEILSSPHFSGPVRNAHKVPTFVGASREGFRPGKLLPKQLATGEHFTSLKTCEMFRLALLTVAGAPA